jgi:hypothetical protein
MEATSKDLMGATGKGLIEFLNYTSEKGMVNSNTVGALRAASREVLGAVEPEGWEAVDLRTIDVEDFANRFERLRAGRLKPESLGVYKSRFRSALQMYFKYLDNPSGWRYKPERPAASRKKPATVIVPSDGVSGVEAQPTDARSPRSSTIDYPFPLRPGMVVTLKLPVDLTRPEAKRLAGFIDSLALDATMALPAHVASTAASETNGNH